MLSTVGQQTEVFVRFSTVAGNKGSFDLARDVRGFAVKFYTREGNWDLVGNNIPVFFIQDAIKFPDLVHAVKQEPDRAFPQAQSAHDNFWDFASLTPGGVAHDHVADVATGRSRARSARWRASASTASGWSTPRANRPSSSSTGSRKQGLQSVLWNEAVKINGADPDFHRRDLWEAIEAGDFPQWELGVQLFDQETADSLPFDHLDPTKIIPEEDVPVRIVGTLTLNRNVDNFFAETEQVAFCTQNVPPGIDFSDDPLLHGRNFSYLDTQLKRLGSPNFTHIPINAPRCPVDELPAGRAHGDAQPEGPRQLRAEQLGCGRRPARKSGDRLHQLRRADRGRRSSAIPLGNLRRSLQPGAAYSSSASCRSSRSISATRWCSNCRKVERVDIRARAVSHLRNIDEGLAATVADGLGMALPAAAAAARPTLDLPASATLSILANGPDSFKGRKVGILLTDGSDAKICSTRLTAALEKEGAVWEVIAPKIGGVTLDDGTEIAARAEDRRRPVGAVRCRRGPAVGGGGNLLAQDAAAKDFVSDAFGHCKFIGYSDGAAALFAEARIPPELDAGFVNLAKSSEAKAFVEQCRALRFWPRELEVDLDAASFAKGLRNKES